MLIKMNGVLLAETGKDFEPDNVWIPNPFDLIGEGVEKGAEFTRDTVIEGVENVIMWVLEGIANVLVDLSFAIALIGGTILLFTSIIAKSQRVGRWFVYTQLTHIFLTLLFK
ncbi:hypothetical protein HNQ94_000382 [Salirhabdus euzebyi]|uniref:Uncharacterized protein n=1 Tax=Salirhabdus euzebyi TaxID=394506 RepID=A0A841PYE6_9BACI|nr:hypothetical protein [Salirhabdus euzebyi]MBB6451961.1 hypothetical protein [Salirhabdus euzebyi]